MASHPRADLSRESAQNPPDDNRRHATLEVDVPEPHVTCMGKNHDAVAAAIREPPEDLGIHDIQVVASQISCIEKAMVKPLDAAKVGNHDQTQSTWQE